MLLITSIFFNWTNKNYFSLLPNQCSRCHQHQSVSNRKIKWKQLKFKFFKKSKNKTLNEHFFLKEEVLLLLMDSTYNNLWTKGKIDGLRKILFFDQNFSSHHLLGTDHNLKFVFNICKTIQKHCFLLLSRIN